MKADTLRKKSITIESIYEEVKQANERGDHKYIIPHFRYVSDNTRLKLLKDGYKVYEGSFGHGLTGLIIEW